MAHESNWDRNIGSQSQPNPPSYFVQKHGMTGDQASNASKASGY